MGQTLVFYNFFLVPVIGMTTGVHANFAGDMEFVHCCYILHLLLPPPPPPAEEGLQYGF